MKVKKDWEIKKLGELTLDKMSYGTSSPSCEYDGETRYIRITDINDKGELNKDFVSPISYEEKHVLQDGDIVFARTGATVGKAYCYHSSDEKYVYAGYLIRLRPNRKIVLPDYIFYYTKSKNYLDFISASQVAAAQPNVNAEKYSNLEIPLPPLEEQKRIVKILDEKFAQLETIKTNAQTNLQNAKDLFQSQLTKAFSNTTWEKKRLFEICQNIVDCPHTTPKKSVVPTDYPCIRTSELKNGEIDWTTMQYLEKEEYLKRITSLEPKENDIVYGREGTFGDAVLLPNTHHFSLGQRTMLLRPNSDIINPKFLLKAIISPYVYKQALEKNNGCGVPHVNVADVKNFIIPVPSAEIQKRIVKELDTLSEKVRQLQEIYTKQIADCDELKQSLLQKAFEGAL